MPWAKSNPYADTCESGGKLQDRPPYLIFGLSGRKRLKPPMQTFETANANVCVKMHKRLRENAHIFGSMGKMQLLHGAFGNTDGIPPLDNPTFCPPFHLLFYKKLYLCETYLERWSDTGDS